MIIEAIAAGVIIADWAYHRFWVDEPEVKREKRRLLIPRVDNGTPVGLLYGRTRVREPVLSWAQTPGYGAEGYMINTFHTLGVTFGGGTNLVHGMWIGEDKALWDDVPGFPLQKFARFSDTLTGYYRHGNVEMLDGNSAQEIVDDVGVAQTGIGDLLLAAGVPAASIPSYRGVLTAACFAGGSSATQFVLGPNASLPAFSFEASSYRAYPWLANQVHHKIDDDANPMCVLYDLLTGTLGKGAIPASYIHDASWRSCASTLYAERHGYSNVLSQARTLGAHVLDLLRQVDGVLYQDPSDGLIHAKLVRADYSLAAAREINKSNCKDIINFSIGNPRDNPNRVRVLYTSREHDYNERDAVAGNSIDQSTIESTLEFPGISNRTQAYRAADRELGWRNMPSIKMRALVDRSFYDTAPGDVVRVSWTSPDISNNLPFRVARVDRGTLTEGIIGLDLILDAAYSPPRFTPAQNPIPPRKDDPRR